MFVLLFIDKKFGLKHLLVTICLSYSSSHPVIFSFYSSLDLDLAAVTPIFHQPIQHISPLSTSASNTFHLPGCHKLVQMWLTKRACKRASCSVSVSLVTHEIFAIPCRNHISALSTFFLVLPYVTAKNEKTNCFTWALNPVWYLVTQRAVKCATIDQEQWVKTSKAFLYLSYNTDHNIKV